MKKATLSLANLYLRNHLEQGKSPAQLQFLHATKDTLKPPSECDKLFPIWRKRTSTQDVASIFVFFFLCFFFWRLEKSMSECNEKQKKKHAVALVQKTKLRYISVGSPFSSCCHLFSFFCSHLSSVYTLLFSLLLLVWLLFHYCALSILLAFLLRK